MKKSILVFMLLAVLTIGCREKKNNKDKVNSSPETENLELKKEINSIESASTEIENVKIEIEKSSEKLDELLKDL